MPFSISSSFLSYTDVPRCVSMYAWAIWFTYVVRDAHSIWKKLLRTETDRWQQYPNTATLCGFELFNLLAQHSQKADAHSMPQVPQLLFLRRHEIGRTRTSWNASFRHGILEHFLKSLLQWQWVEILRPRPDVGHVWYEDVWSGSRLQLLWEITPLGSFRLHANYTSITVPCRDLGCGYPDRKWASSSTDRTSPRSALERILHLRISVNADGFGLHCCNAFQHFSTSLI